MLDKRESFKSIARELDKDCTTISKEVKNHPQIEYFYKILLMGGS